MNETPKISVCIPAYNRAAVLPALLDSIVAQETDGYEILICEDCSPQRAAIAQTAAEYASRYPGRIRYIENARNLGYDGNLRRMIDLARGDYVLFMGNDDLMCPGALTKVSDAIGRYPSIGVVLRSYASFDERPENISQEFKYFPQERFFPAGADAIATIYRRSVVISGMVVQRECAKRHATDRFDGFLLYQLHLVANILSEMNGVYLPDILVLYRNHGIPDFGNSEAERGKFVPNERTPASSLHFMHGMLEIAAHAERTRGVAIYERILKDIGNYSYPVLAIQADKPLRVFFDYYRGLARMGFWKSRLFHLYFVSLITLGPRRVEAFIRWVKNRLGYTPTIGDVYRGRQV